MKKKKKRTQKKLSRLLTRADRLLARLDSLFGAPADDPDDFLAYRWRGDGTGRGHLEGIDHPQAVELGDLLCMDHQKSEILRNTQRFVDGHPANNVLLWGSRGTGKSSLVKAVWHRYRHRGLKIIEVDKAGLADLPEIIDRVFTRPDPYLLYCDDLSFDAGDSSYTALKALLEGSLSAPPDNLRIYATSNRRHLLPEFFHENRESRVVDGEIHQGEAVEEKISLSERFGLWLSFYPFDQAQYLAIADHWLTAMNAATTADPATRKAALQWATRRGSRSGRVARQFAVDWAGRTNGEF
ncbi:MAG: ATP-binding protein [Pseudomonadota bacterium]